VVAGTSKKCTLPKAIALLKKALKAKSRAPQAGADATSTPPSSDSLAQPPAAAAVADVAAAGEL
jgi:hypothetical protein